MTPVTAIVPAYQAETTVDATVRTLLAATQIEDVLVVDDGSTDSTAARAAAAGASVIRLDENLGKGGAVARALGEIDSDSTILLVDADVADTAAAAVALLEPVATGRADLAIGVLPDAAGRGGFGLVRTLSAWGIKRACGFEARAPLSGQRAAPIALLRVLPLARRFGLETAMTIDAVRAGAKVVEIDVDMDHTHHGRTLGGFAHRARQGLDVVRVLVPRLLRR